MQRKVVPSRGWLWIPRDVSDKILVQTGPRCYQHLSTRMSYFDVQNDKEMDTGLARSRHLLQVLFVEDDLLRILRTIQWSRILVHCALYSAYLQLVSLDKTATLVRTRRLLCKDCRPGAIVQPASLQGDSRSPRCFVVYPFIVSVAYFHRPMFLLSKNTSRWLPNYWRAHFCNAMEILRKVFEAQKSIKYGGPQIFDTGLPKSGESIWSTDQWARVG